MSDPVLYAVTGRVATITLNRPETRNALSEDVQPALCAALKRADAATGVSCVLLRAEGKGFSSGGNLHEIKAMTRGDNTKTIEEIERWYTDGIQMIPKTFADLTVPVVCAVHGHAIGAGCDLTTMCDIRIAAENAIFAESFLKVGIIPGDGGCWFLPRVIGMARAKQMLFTGRWVDAATALDWGLVSEVVPTEDLDAKAMAWAEEIAALPPQALRQSKQLIHASETATLEDGLNMAAHMQARLQQLSDHHEAVDALLEKRKPVFTGE